MERIVRISLLVIPALVTAVIILSVVSNGRELTDWIDDFLLESFNLLMSTWEMDHLTFALCLGLPPSIVAITLGLFKQLRLWRVLLGIIFFYLVQLFFVIIIGYFVADSQPYYLANRRYLSTPNPDFWNYALIISFILTYTVLFSSILFTFTRSKKPPSTTLDSND